jgi:hypothetical protein
VAYIVNNTNANPFHWSAPLLPTRTDVADLRRIAGLLAAATPLPPLGTAPTPGLDRYHQTAVMGFRWVIDLTGHAPVKVAPGIEKCAQGATEATGCTLDWNDAMIAGKPESVPGLLTLLQHLPSTPVPPLTVHLTPRTPDGQVTIVGRGWVGPQAQISVSWTTGAPPWVPLGPVPVAPKGRFTWTGHLPTRPAGTSAFVVVVSDGVRGMSVPPVSL